MITVNDEEDDQNSSSSDDDSFAGFSPNGSDADELNEEEKMLQREIIKNFVAIKKRDNKAKTSGYMYYHNDINKKSFMGARFSTKEGKECESDVEYDSESDLEDARKSTVN